MSTRTLWLAAMVAVAAFITLAGGGCKSSEPDETIEPTGPFAEIQKVVPKSAELVTWKRDGVAAIYLGQPALAEPGVDAAQYKKFADSPLAASGPLFAEYKVRVVLSQPFTMKTDNGPEKLTVTICQMNDADEAFGILAVAGTGEPCDGAWLAGKKTAGSIAFAKGPYFVKVEKVTPGVTAEALTIVAANVAGKIFSGSALPALAAKLPTENLVPGSIVYLHGPEGLKRADALLALKMEPLITNALGDARMVLATYRLANGGSNTVFIIDRSLGMAVPPLERLESYLNGASVVDRNRFAYTVIANRFMVGTFNAEEESVQHVLPKIIKGFSAGA